MTCNAFEARFHGRTTGELSRIGMNFRNGSYDARRGRRDIWSRVRNTFFETAAVNAFDEQHWMDARLLWNCLHARP